MGTLYAADRKTRLSRFSSILQKKAEQRPDHLYAQYNLGHAYILNGEYENAIDFMSDHHRKHPWIGDYQYVILDALFALDKDEGDFNWVENRCYSQCICIATQSAFFLYNFTNVMICRSIYLLVMVAVLL